ncbi:MAG TPA: STAS domain-containing protein [Solirubrobacteraceae bacterium]
MRADAYTDGCEPRDGAELALRRALRPRGPVRLALTKHLIHGITVIDVEGELDVLTAPSLALEIDHVVRRQSGDMVLDLRSTGFVDSAGLGLLLSTRRRLARHQRALTVMCDTGPVWRVIARARLLDALGVVSSPEGHDAGPTITDLRQTTAPVASR